MVDFLARNAYFFPPTQLSGSLFLPCFFAAPRDTNMSRIHEKSVRSAKTLLFVPHIWHILLKIDLKMYSLGEIFIILCE